MKNGNLFDICLTGVWFRLEPYSNELYSELRAELIIEGEVIDSWLLSDIPHKEVRRFGEPPTVNADSDYLIKTHFSRSV